MVDVRVCAIYPTPVQMKLTPCQRCTSVLQSLSCYSFKGGEDVLVKIVLRLQVFELVAKLKRTNLARKILKNKIKFPKII